MTLIFLESNRTFFRHPDNPIKNLVDFLELDQNHMLQVSFKNPNVYLNESMKKNYLFTKSGLILQSKAN